MAQSSQPSEPAENEHAGLPMVMSEPGEHPESWLARVMRILFGWKAASTRADLELVLTAEQQPQSGFSPEEAAMLKNILGLRETRIERIMVPRADIVAVQQDITLGDLVKVFEVAGHSRLVVYNDTLDDPTGMVHIRDLIAFMASRAAQPPAKDGRSRLRPSSRTPATSILQISIFRCRWRRRRSCARSCMRRRQCRRSICWPRCRPPAFTLRW